LLATGSQHWSVSPPAASPCGSDAEVAAAAQLPSQRHGTLNVASASVATQPATEHEPSSTWYSGAKLPARLFVQPRKSGAQRPSSVVAVAS